MSVDAEEIDPRAANLNGQTCNVAVYRYYFSSVGLLLVVVRLALVIVPRNAQKPYEELLSVVIEAPLAFFFTKTDTGATRNRGLKTPHVE
jgi:hypothetical protein